MARNEGGYALNSVGRSRRGLAQSLGDLVPGRIMVQLVRVKARSAFGRAETLPVTGRAEAVAASVAGSGCHFKFSVDAFYVRAC